MHLRELAGPRTRASGLPLRLPLALLPFSSQSRSKSFARSIFIFGLRLANNASGSASEKSSSQTITP
jgi:hypothetical protein